ncbi:MAG: peptide chain release factor N(5)-glutamine methyltransferase [Pseudopedobacter saltans]|uniref:Release factor glutamine methyltransferase n=1 Tax=Pseudopedobacter saltans TaxID=151895 RepID=A0A2W5F5R9_9SPHI|nr:MAG: peptide chain release factor N(5)-glutamine methyltransferase [Pseudopedobacter saltans]
MTIQEAKKHLLDILITIYDQREAASIAAMVMEKLTGLDRIQSLIKKDAIVTLDQETLLEKWTKDLLAQRPVQYVLEEAWFYGFSFYVKEGVLIPRPETEQLVEWVMETMRDLPGTVLDIGSGSGCIAITLAKLKPHLHVFSVDKSEEALAIARENNRRLKTAVDFRQMDILAVDNIDIGKKLDAIVSNPPYIKEMEKQDMHTNVLNYEPEMALFVPDSDPLLFYRKIAELSSKTLRSEGYLFFEINEQYGKEVVNLLALLGFSDIELKKDIQGKDRMVKALWVVN